jgi:hypothetical protein
MADHNSIRREAAATIRVASIDPSVTGYVREDVRGRLVVDSVSLYAGSC